MLLTVTFDPVHDTPEVLAQYASQWNADPATWHFLTGTGRLTCSASADMFGVDFFPDEGLMNHSLTQRSSIDRGNWSPISKATSSRPINSAI